MEAIFGFQPGAVLLVWAKALSSEVMATEDDQRRGTECSDLADLVGREPRCRNFIKAWERTRNNAALTLQAEDRFNRLSGNYSVIHRQVFRVRAGRIKLEKADVGVVLGGRKDENMQVKIHGGRNSATDKQ